MSRVCLVLSLLLANPSVPETHAHDPSERWAQLKQRLDLQVDVGARDAFIRRRIAETNSVFANQSALTAERALVWGTTSLSPGIGVNLRLGEAHLCLNWDFGKVGLGAAKMSAFATKLTVPGSTFLTRAARASAK